MATKRSDISRYLTIALVQGGADTFVEGSVATGIIPQNGLGYKVLGVDLSFTQPFAALSADAYVLWSLTRDTKTAAVGLTDNDAILYDGFSVALTTSGSLFVPQQYSYRSLEGIYLVEPTIYAQLQSAATGITNIGAMRVYYEEVALSEVDILRILNNA